MRRQWSLQEAKDCLDQVVEQAATSGPQTITVRGRLKVVILSIEEYEFLTKPATSLVEFFRNSPFYGSDLDLERSADTGRDIEL